MVGIFLHGITSESDVSIDYIKEHFGDRAAMIVDGYSKISAIQTLLNMRTGLNDKDKEL